MPRSGANQHNMDNVLSQWAAIPPPPECLDKEGACVGKPPTGFFLETSSQKHPALLDALSCCEICPVRKPCLEYALGLPWGIDFGIWGGTNRNQRKAMRDGKS